MGDTGQSYYTEGKYYTPVSDVEDTADLDTGEEKITDEIWDTMPVITEKPEIPVHKHKNVQNSVIASAKPQSRKLKEDAEIVVIKKKRMVHNNGKPTKPTDEKQLIISSPNTAKRKKQRKKKKKEH